MVFCKASYSARGLLQGVHLHEFPVQLQARFVQLLLIDLRETPSFSATPPTSQLRQEKMQAGTTQRSYHQQAPGVRQLSDHSPEPEAAKNRAEIALAHSSMDPFTIKRNKTREHRN